MKEVILKERKKRNEKKKQWRNGEKKVKEPKE